MPPQILAKKDSKRSAGTIKWTEDLRLGLHLLNSDYRLTRKQLTIVFNSVFAEYLASCGLPHGAKESSVNAQYAKSERVKPAWAFLRAVSLSQAEEDRRKTLRNKIHVALGTTPTVRTSGGSNDSPGLSAFAYTTPASVPRKRPLTAVGEDTTHNPPKRSKAHNSSGIVVVARHTEHSRATPTGSLSRTYKKFHKLLSPWSRRDGTVIEDTAANIAQIPKFVYPPSNAKSQPPLPPLLFRFSVPGTPGGLGDEGFCARFFANCNVWPGDPPVTLPVEDVFYHLDRKKIASKLISTSCRLIWVLQLAIKEMSAGNRGNITVIDTSKLDRQTVWWAQPYHAEIKKSKGFSNGAWHYQGTYEWLVWRCIPQNAIIGSFEVGGLNRLAAGNESIGDILHMDLMDQQALDQRPISLTAKSKILRERCLPLTMETSRALAKICVFLGIDAASPVGHVSHAVSDLVEGWGLQIRYRNEESWQHFASSFVRTMFDSARTRNVPLDFKARTMLEFAVLDGIAWASGPINCRFRTDLLAKKHRAAAAVGLADPAKIIVHGVEACKLHVQAYQMKQDRVLQDQRGRVQSATTRWRSDNKSVYDEDDVSDTEGRHYANEEEVEEEDGAELDVFCMNKDGMVV